MTLEEISAWYQANADRLPHELQVEPGVKIVDLPLAMQGMIETSRRHPDDRAFLGQHQLLLRIYQKLTAR